MDFKRQISEISSFTRTRTGVIVTVIAGLWLLWTIFSKKRPANAPPTATLGIPFFGTYIEFAKNPVEFIDKCRAKFGNIYTVNMLHKKLTFLLGPEASNPFFNQKDDTNLSQAEVYGFMTPVFGKGVVYDAPIPQRKEQYNHMAKGLKGESFKAYVGKIERECHEYVKDWGAEGEQDMLQALSELTILTSSRCLHGDDVRENLFREVSDLYHDLDKGVTPLSFFFPYAPTAAHKLRDAARVKMVDIFAKVIALRRLKTEAETQDATDILQVFIDMKYKDGSCLSNDEVVGLLIALLFAGQHTSSISSTWTLMFLLHNEGCLEKVLSEQRAVLGDKFGTGVGLAFDDVNKMEYLENCVMEALRLHPPLIMLMRMALKDVNTTLNGKVYTIPAGDIVVTSPAVSSRLDDVFTNPNSFDPERFAQPREEHKKKPFSFLGFGGGNHTCIGNRFGMLQIKTVLSMLLNTYKFERITKEFPEPDYAAMVVGPKNHCKVKFTRLDDRAPSF